jgi:hypothetical protein
MSRAATIPTLGVGESGRAGCFSLLVVLRVRERETVDATGDDERSPLVTAAVVKEDGVRV